MFNNNTDVSFIINNRIAIMSGIVIFVSVFLVASYIYLIKRIKKKPEAFQSLLKLNSKLSYISFMIITGAVMVLTILSLNNIRDKVKHDIGEQLTSMLETTHEAMSLWIHDNSSDVINLANSTEIMTYGNNLIKSDINDELLEFEEMHASLLPKYEGEFKIIILNKDGKILNHPKEHDYVISDIYTKKYDFFLKALNGETLFIPPMEIHYKSVSSSHNSRSVAMYFITPLKDSNGMSNGIVALEFEPSGEFTKLNALGRFGKTAETYSIDKNGYMLSESRFLDELIDYGIVEFSGENILQFQVLDPGMDLKKSSSRSLAAGLSYTEMAQDITEGKSGMNIEGYRNYMGVEVCGIWLWDESLGMGMTTEIALAEALGIYHIVKNIVLFLLALILLIFLSIMHILGVVSLRTQRYISLMNEGLEKQIYERTNALYQAMKKAESGNMSKTIFIGNMSHEIKTPMNAILGHAQILKQDKALNVNQMLSIKSILENGFLLLDMINEVIDVSKFDSDSIVLSISSFDLESNMISMLSKFKDRIEAKGLTVTLTIDPSVPAIIQTDKTRMNHIVFSLVDNAIKFTNIGLISINIEEKDGLILIHVKDTGVGINPNSLDDIFDSFIQIERTAQPLSGIGMGLAVSKRMSKVFGGDITVSSKIDVGSEFVFSFKYNAGTSDGTHDKTYKTVKRLRDEYNNTKVLIVDNKSENRYIVKVLLERVGFLTKEASDGQDAIEISKSWMPQIILMDIMTPVMNGIEASQIIKTSEWGKGISIFAISPSSNDHAKFEMMNTGVLGVIDNPFMEMELYSIIQSYTNIEFEYEEDVKSDEIDSKEFKNTTNMLPTDLVDRIKNAIILGDIELLDKLIEEVKNYDSNFALIMEEKIRKFDFDELLNYLHDGSNYG